MRTKCSCRVNNGATRQKRLRSLAKNYAETIEKGILNNDNLYPSFIVNDTANCLDIQLLFLCSQQIHFEVSLHGTISLTMIMELAGIAGGQQEKFVCNMKFLEVFSFYFTCHARRRLKKLERFSPFL